MNISKPDLSIVIPTYNEQQNLPLLLENLSKQHNISIQIIIVDGGSHDKTLQICQTFAGTHDCLCLNSLASRPAQMNLGAKHAHSSLLLFLHADTTITDDHLLITAVQHFRQVCKAANHDKMAGHFSMQFSETEGLYPKGFYFYAAKTSLNRPDTINGDQGLMISTEFFNTVGRYDENLHFMEDAKIAAKIFELGGWFTLPGIIHTSARRFIVEGLVERQILNSFLCNFNHIGLQRFFELAETAYQTQIHTQRLQLQPFLGAVNKLMQEMGIIKSIKMWYQIGAYVASNTWQLIFKLDCDRHFKRGELPRKVIPRYLGTFDNYLAWFFRLSPTKATTGVLTFLWFYSLWIKY